MHLRGEVLRRGGVVGIRVVSLLAPALAGFYRSVALAIGPILGGTVDFVPDGSYRDYAAGEFDVAFVCGLAYAEFAEGPDPGVPVAAPVVRGERYGGRPVYFSDVVVASGAGIDSFEGLRGRTWAFNEPLSQSGYGITRYRLAALGETGGFFGRVVEAGSHDRALRMVLEGEADGAAIDSHLLGVMLRDDPALRGRIRIVDALGPSPIQPVVVARRVDPAIRDRIGRALTSLPDDDATASGFESAMVERFVAVGPDHYDAIRRMTAECREAGLTVLG